MRDLLKERVLPIGLLLSLLLHFFFFSLIITLGWTVKETENQKTPHLYTPAYIHQGSIVATTSAYTEKGMTQAESSRTASSLPETFSKTATIALGKPVHHKVSRIKQNRVSKRSIMSMTYQFFQQNQREMMTTAEQEDEPIYLVGDSNSPVDPLVKLLGRALSAHFEYPRVAGMLGIKGRALVGLTLHPNGHLANIQLIQSTESQELDAAALYAANSAPTIKGVSKFISKPKRFVIGFVFR